MQTFYKGLENCVLNSGLSDEYTRKLIACVGTLTVFNPAYATPIKDRKQYKGLIESARANLRGARAQATFSDLYKFNYARFEWVTLRLYSSRLLRSVSGRHEQYILTGI